MKVRLAALLTFAISFALPTFAQEKEEVNPFPFTPIPAGPQLVQQIEAINQKFDEAFNKHDAAAVGELYTTNAVQTTPGGSFSGREAIEGYIRDFFQRHSPSDRVTKMSYVYAFGGDLCALGGWTITIDGSRKFGGYLVVVYTFVGGTWKIRASMPGDFSASRRRLNRVKCYSRGAYGGANPSQTSLLGVRHAISGRQRTMPCLRLARRSQQGA